MLAFEQNVRKSLVKSVPSDFFHFLRAFENDVFSLNSFKRGRSSYIRTLLCILRPTYFIEKSSHFFVPIYQLQITYLQKYEILKINRIFFFMWQFRQKNIHMNLFNINSWYYSTLSLKETPPKVRFCGCILFPILIFDINYQFDLESNLNH